MSRKFDRLENPVLTGFFLIPHRRVVRAIMPAMKPYTEIYVDMKSSVSRYASIRGFTLIELLVVIAIIGILSSVVLASLVLARLKGSDATIKSNLHTIQVMMELIYDERNPNSYGPTNGAPNQAASSIAGGLNVFAADPRIKAPLQAALNQGGSIYYYVGPSTSSFGSTYAVAVRMKEKPPAGLGTFYWWCVDSSGTAARKTDLSGAALGDPGAPAACP
jgi:prepilin-type N-terminal cleavage/methylation domain-containing protein